MKVITGNLVEMLDEGIFEVGIQGCNCHCRMKSGIAKEWSEMFPESVTVDNATTKGSKDKLGLYSEISVIRGGHPVHLINAYTQFTYGRDPDILYIDYGAVERVFREIKKQYSGFKIAYPMIGCGLANGDWEIVSQIINTELEGEDHTFVKFGRGS